MYCAEAVTRIIWLKNEVLAIYASELLKRLLLVCILALLLCSLFQISFNVLFQLFAGLVIGWFYRLCHGRRSKTAAYVIVGICTAMTCTLWVVLMALLSVAVSPAPFTAVDLVRLWNRLWEPLLLCIGLGLIGFFCCDHRRAVGDNGR